MQKNLKIGLCCLLIMSLLVGCQKHAGKLELQTEFETTTNETLETKKMAGENAVPTEIKTYTGLPSLPLADFKIEDPENTKGLSTKKIGYSYGVAKEGKPHATSIGNQNYFETKGFKAICLDQKTEEKVLYLTFDCGYENGYTAKILDILKEKQVPAAFFCTLPQVKATPELIARMIQEGHIVGNHSVHHPSFPEITRLAMAEEIKGMDDYLRLHFGYSAPFFRFPKGEYSDSALELVGSLGYTSVFWSLAYADWDLNQQKGGEHAFQMVTSRLHPGAILLLHSVSPDNCAALPKIIDYAREQGYTFRALTDFPTN